MNLSPEKLPTPCYVCDEEALERNLKVIAHVRRQTGCKILLAQKGFAMFSVYPLVSKYLDGTCASSLNEARLGSEEFGGEVHIYAPAYKDEEMDDILSLADHIVFNSFSQWHRYRDVVQAAERPIQCGLRINPEYSEVSVDLYNPCAKHSRFGVTRRELEGHDVAGLTGMHFHTLCEQNAAPLIRTLEVIEEKFDDFLEHVQWVNFGGGHHISRPDYDVAALCEAIVAFQKKNEVDVYLEPGEAIALHAGQLVTTVLDIVQNEMPIAILDCSATAHMPDVLEMPYRPRIQGADEPGRRSHTFRLGGLTCLAGDVIGDYSFDTPLRIGQRLVFEDMAHYTMVKNTTFNGVPLPAIAVRRLGSDTVEIVREFGYEDYRSRLS